MRKVILTADDFGLALPVNEAVERACRDGVLTAASLMVGGAAAADAVARARRLPGLRVGLHLVLVEGRPVLPPNEVPDLVDASGDFSRRLFRAGVRFFFRPGVRRQLEAEIRAQFEVFRATGLELDHVNAHNHMHLHPTVLGLLLKVGKDYGVKAVRVPSEPLGPSLNASRAGVAGKVAARVFLWPWVTWLRARLRQASIETNDCVFGLYDSGAMNTARTLALLSRLPHGVTELYFHPATRRCPELERDMPDYQHQAELEALLSPAVRAALSAGGVERLGYGHLTGASASDQHATQPAAAKPPSTHEPSEMTKCSAS